MNKKEILNFLEEKYALYNNPDFILTDPISIPHQFSRKEDIEISGMLTALIAWGRRDIIIKNADALMARMDRSPYSFVMNAGEEELEALEGFVHRTFNALDCNAIVKGLKHIYENHDGLEAIFEEGIKADQLQAGTWSGIMNFRNKMASTPDFPLRTLKHLASPEKGSAAKRINMFLRWMVRSDRRKVDFGLWKGIPTHKLICPLDVHSGNVARKLGLLKRKQNDWKAAMELTDSLRVYDENDPVKYDFSLFGLGVFENF